MARQLPNGKWKLYKKDIKKYERYCHLWAEALFLHAWNIVVSPADVITGPGDDDAVSGVDYDIFNKEAEISIIEEWPENMEPDDLALMECALHEVLHILLAPMTSMALERCNFSERQFNDLEHDAIKNLSVHLMNREN